MGLPSPADPPTLAPRAPRGYKVEGLGFRVEG